MNLEWSKLLYVEHDETNVAKLLISPTLTVV